MPRWEQPCSRKTRYQKIRKKNAPTNSSNKEARAYVLVPENCDASHPPEDISSPESTRTSTPDEILSKDSSCSSWSPRSWSPEIDDDSPPSPILNRHNAKRKAKFNSDVTSDSKNEFVPEVHKRSGEIFGDSFIKDRLVKLHNSVVVPVKRNCTVPKPANCRNGMESTSGLASSGLSNLVGEPYKLSTELVSSYGFNNDLMRNGYKMEPHDEFSNLVEEQSELRTAVDGSYGFSNNLVETSNELTNLVVPPYGLGNNMELPVELSQIKQEDEFHECVYIKEEPHDISQQLEIKQEIDSSIDPPETVFLNEFPLESIVKEEKVEYV